MQILTQKFSVLATSILCRKKAGSLKELKRSSPRNKTSNKYILMLINITVYIKTIVTKFVYYAKYAKG